MLKGTKIMQISKTQQQKWQAEDDARTMANYQEIMGDKARMSRAIKVAQQQASDLSKRADAMKRVASTRGRGAARTVTKGRRK